MRLEFRLQPYRKSGWAPEPFLDDIMKSYTMRGIVFYKASVIKSAAEAYARAAVYDDGTYVNSLSVEMSIDTVGGQNERWVAHAKSFVPQESNGYYHSVAMEVKHRVMHRSKLAGF